ncbi:hypothetical protein SWPG_00169 [Synechococcus phage S-CBM2]|nr:hypothetical protein SWPG_00169 [Synechococcus phage S-CBM2]
MIDPNNDMVNISDFDNDWVEEFLTEQDTDIDFDDYDDSSIGTEFDIDMRGDWG